MADRGALADGDETTQDRSRPGKPLDKRARFGVKTLINTFAALPSLTGTGGDFYTNSRYVGGELVGMSLHRTGGVIPSSVIYM